ncbi:MAG TPA: hypothetical protein VM534_06555, partial [Thermoanaerobaculia bacterium]|nr:hypothetical protein [Thermoanaerobaculia bacterium]
AVGRYPEAVSWLSRAAEQQGPDVNEYVVDTWYWLARAHVRAGSSAEARRWAEKVAGSSGRERRRRQAEALLAEVG